MSLRTNVSGIVSAVFLLSVAACASTKPEATADLNAGLEIAAALESAYDARPAADPKVVADLTRLMASAQAAVASWEVSNSPTDQAVASAAISALVAYESSTQITP